MKITKRQLRRIIREAVASDSSIIPVEELEWAPEPGRYGKAYMRLAFADGEDVIGSISTPEEFEAWKTSVGALTAPWNLVLKRSKQFIPGHGREHAATSAE